MTPPPATKEKLVEVAADLFLKQGYHATGVMQILRAAGARSGSLYYFFPSKEHLLIAVLERYVDLLWPLVLEPIFSKIDDPIERIFGVLDGYRAMLDMTQFTRGCPIGNLALELSDAYPEVRELVARNFQGWCDGIRQCLDAAADRLPPDTDRAALAQFILTVMEGAVMQARAHKSMQPFDASVSMLRDYFDRLMSDQTAGHS